MYHFIFLRFLVNIYPPSTKTPELQLNARFLLLIYSPLFSQIDDPFYFYFFHKNVFLFFTDFYMIYTHSRHSSTLYFQDMADRLIIHSQHFTTPLALTPAHIQLLSFLKNIFIYYYYLLPVYSVSAGVLRFNKNANPQNFLFIYFIVLPTLSKFPSDPVYTSALPELTIFTLI